MKECDVCNDFFDYDSICDKYECCSQGCLDCIESEVVTELGE